MPLLQISEPGQSSAPHQHKLAAGIDLGTTNSLIATVKNALVEVLLDENQQALLPSVVRYTENETIVGYSAKNHLVTDTYNTLSSIKRLMGRGIDDLKTIGKTLPYRFSQDYDNSHVPRIETDYKTVTAVEVSAEILKVLKQRAEGILGDDLQGVVITVPAYFDEAQRQATKDAATLAQLPVLRLLNEPTAAAIAYGLDKEEQGIIAVYDLGGGTFDISILRLQKGVFEVLATGGDSALGGDDFDRAIVNWIIEQADIKENISQNLAQELMQVAKKAKEILTTEDQADIIIHQWQGILTKAIFNQLIHNLISSTIIACRKSLKDAGLSIEEIDNVVMVGGSTRVPYVRSQVENFFQKPPMVDIDPDQVVAIGAALQANVLVGNKTKDEMLLLDVNPLSLGIETMGGLVEKIISRNTPIPVARAQEFTTYKDGQTAMALHVVQGERELVSDCRSLARFELRGIPALVAGQARIKVTFQIDADGLLQVSAQETTTKITSGITVKPSYGLEEQEIQAMLQQGMQHAKQDAHSRKVKEAQVEAKRTLEALAAALEKDFALLTPEEKENIETAKENLLNLLESTDSQIIIQATQALEKTSESFVAKRMNKGVQTALAGKNINDIGE